LSAEAKGVTVPLLVIFENRAIIADSTIADVERLGWGGGGERQNSNSGPPQGARNGEG